MSEHEHEWGQVSRDVHPTSIRLDPRLKAWLSAEAARQGRTTHNYIVWILGRERGRVERHEDLDIDDLKERMKGK